MMKKYVVLLVIITSGLVHAAAEPSKAKKINCADLARHMREKQEFPYIAFKWDSDGDRVVHIGQQRVGDWGCDELVEDKWQRVSRRAAEHTNGQLLVLERCVQESPEYAQEPEVKVMIDFFKRQADLWPQCLKVQKEGAAQLHVQKKKEQDMDVYIKKYGNPSRRNFFERWFPG
jgi:hypothetical protein